MKVMNEPTWSHTRTIYISLIDEARNSEYRLIYRLVNSKILFHHLSPHDTSIDKILYLVASFKAILKTRVA